MLDNGEKDHSCAPPMWNRPRGVLGAETLVPRSLDDTAWLCPGCLTVWIIRYVATYAVNSHMQVGLERRWMKAGFLRSTIVRKKIRKLSEKV